MERNEAIEVIKKNYPHVAESGSQFETALRTIIPELKESREDEMIRVIKEVILNSVPYKINILTKDTTITAEEAIAWLEKQGEQKPAWSEEDEETLNTIINHFKIDIECTDEDDIVRWLNRLKERYTWKPSDRQMNTLEQWLKDNQYKGDARYCYPIFESLYQDLKKLKE